MKMDMDFWKQHVEGAKREGGSTRAYAKRHSLSVDALYYWQHKLQPATKAEPIKASKFVALRLADVDADAMQRSVACSLLMPSGIRLEMTTLPSPQWIAALVDATKGQR